MASPPELAAALASVAQRIEAAAKRAGRDPAEVRLVAVSKTQPQQAIEDAFALGQRRFGENYAQELRDKARALAGHAVEWHFIGPLQRNKVKYVVGTARLIHAVETLDLATEIARLARARDLVQEILVEVNVAREPQKHGIAPEGLADLLTGIEALPNVRCRGLMTMAPFSDDPTASRPFFRALRALAERHGRPELSMGMTQDLEVAVEEGATLVRVGTALFGERGPR
jgi:pyridoxal phosphate enzyme (YggS family)